MTYDDIRAALDRAAATDPQLRSLTKKIRAGKATFTDTAAYSQRLSALLGQVFSAEVESLSPEEREAICRALLRGHYDEINRILEEVQETLDEAQGLSLTPQRAPYPAERVGQLAHSLQDATVPVETIRRRADTGAANVAHAMHDDYIDVNAKLRNDLGLKCYLTRVVGSTSCKWCDNLAGRYVYGSHPGDIFRRHDNCTCTVTYENGRERQDVWSKRSWEASPAEIMRQAEKPKVFSPAEAEQLQNDLILQFRELQYDAAHPISDTRNFNFGLQRVITAQNPIYVSDGARKAAKPKQIHAVDTHFTEVIKMLGVQRHENLPGVHVLDGMEMGSSAVASYSPIKNTLNLNLAVATYDKAHIPAGMECFAGYKDDRSSYLHELLHWQDAEKFRRRYGDITEQNYSDYVAFINRESKKKLDKLMKTGYNIGGISDYALDQYQKGKFYETYTEFRVADLLRRK